MAQPFTDLSIFVLWLQQTFKRYTQYHLVGTHKRNTTLIVNNTFYPDLIHTLRPRQNGHRFPDDIFKCSFLNENGYISITISLKFVPEGSINNIPPLVQIMAWPRPDEKPLSVTWRQKNNKWPPFTFHGVVLHAGCYLKCPVNHYIIIRLAPRWHPIINKLRPRQNGRHFPDDIFKRILLNENVWIPINISLKFVAKGSISYIPALVPIMAWRRPGDKLLSEPMMVK